MKKIYYTLTEAAVELEIGRPFLMKCIAQIGVKLKGGTMLRISTRDVERVDKFISQPSSPYTLP